MRQLVFIYSIILASALQAAVNTNNPSLSRPLTTRAGDCVRGKQTAILDVNNVRAMLLNSGDLWWDRDKSQYEIPKRTDEQISKGQRPLNPLFNGSVWVSGKAGGNLKLAAITFSQGGRNAWWPGPIKLGESSIEKAKCEKFDRYWSVTSEDIRKAELKQGISTSILEWPGRGNPYLISKGQFTANELSEELAPYNDLNGNCIYDPENGDLPSIKNVRNSGSPCYEEYKKNQFTYGDQMIFWVINDIGNAHTGPSSAPIGAQMNCLAFAFKSSDELNDMTFYSYDIYNKGNVTLEETYMSQYMDTDLGNYNDDLVGCDTSRSLGFVYNGDDFDETTTTQGYLDQPPIFGVDFFEGPKKSNGLPIGLTSFLYYENGSGAPLVDPSTEIEFRNYQEGLSRNGASLTISNDCVSPGFPTTKFCFYGDPSKTGEWSMCGTRSARDFRFVQSSGPFDMTAGSHETITIGCVFVRPAKGTHIGCKPAMNILQDADDKAQRLFDFQFKNSPGPDAPDLKIIEASNNLHFVLENSISSNNFGENYSKTNINIPLSSWNKADTTYKFEGYMVYQVVSENAVSTISDLKDNSKAKLIKIMDKRNNIKRAVNYKSDFVNGQPITIISEDLELPNKGLDYELKIDRDLFQFEGQSLLVNNKTYYFATVAFGFNNYQNPNIATDYQRTQIIYSNAIKIFKGTPHNVNLWGVKLKTDYNQTIPITRIQGQGHGRYFLDLNKKSDEDDIVMNGSKDVIEYSAGRSPFMVKLSDPYKLKNAKFKLTVRDTSFIPLSNSFKFDSTIWKLEITEGTDVKEIYSEGNLDREFSQSIYATINGKLESYGISVANSIADTIATIARNGNKYYGFVGSEMVYKDSTKRWLNMLKDKNSTDYEDWIRTGSIFDRKGKFHSAFNIVNGSPVYTDPFGLYESVLDGSFAPYCLAANTAITAIAAENNYQSFSPGFKWRLVDTDSATMVTSGEGPQNNLDSIYSVDLVITNDRSKWSRAVVFETGESQTFNEGNAFKGQLRQSASVDSFGNPESSKGLGWFPGYAINLETGVRMNVYFGENSRFRGKGAANMIWDPDTSSKTVLGNAIMGGSQFIYVMNTAYENGDRAEKDRNFLDANFNQFTGSGVNRTLSAAVANFYRQIAWTCVPLTARNFNLYNANGIYQIPTDVKIKARVEKPYKKYLGDESIYEFNTIGLAPEDRNDSMKKAAFERMTLVPNPYYAYSSYELNPTQNIVKIVNVPKNSTVSIFTTDGILVRRLKLDDKDVKDEFYGDNSRNVNIDNSIDWDLRTSTGVLIASGIYYVNVETPNVGSKVLKLYATMRAADVSNF
jgi:hypothetical protein